MTRKEQLLKELAAIEKAEYRKSNDPKTYICRKHGIPNHTCLGWYETQAQFEELNKKNKGGE